jgi:DNA end-binding protein Ku
VFTALAQTEGKGTAFGLHQLNKKPFMRSIWKGALGFGLVNIPVQMYAATEESTIPFVSLDKNDNARIRYKKVNEGSGKEVPYSDIVKGYDVGGHLVIVTDEDIKSASPEKMDLLSIVQFVDEEEIDPRYYEKPYYLQPDKNGAKAYALLREALKKEKKVALGPLVFHRREWICAVKPLDNCMVLHRLRFPEEIRDFSELNIPDAQIQDKEMKMAAQLVNQLTEPFDPKQFKDEFSAKLMQVIEAKAKGKGAKVKEMKPRTTTTVDLMESLKASLKPSRKKAS